MTLLSITRRYQQRHQSQALFDDRPLPLYIPVSPKAEAFHASKAKIKLLDGGNQSGKTTAITQEFIRNALSRPPGCQGLCLTNTYKKIGENLWPHLRQWLNPSDWIWGGGNRIADNPSLILLRKNGYKIYFGSYEQDREAHQGAIWDDLLFDEEPPRHVWEETVRGSIAHKAPVLIGFTPLKGSTYMIEDIRAKGLNPAYPDYFALPEPMTLLENPHVSQEEKDIWIDMLSEKSRRSRIYGYATSQEGLVYEEFDDAVHVCDAFPIPDSWRFYRGLDFGGEHPTTSIIMATDGYYIYVVAEYYQAHRLVEYHAEQIRQQAKNLVLKSKSGLIPSLITVSDHDLQLRMQYESQGIYSSPAKKERIAGIETVRNLLKIHSDGNPRLKVFRHCKNTIREFKLYHLPGENRRGALLPGEKADDPVKEFDDCLDPVRYICVEEFGYFEDQIPKIISLR